MSDNSKIMRIEDLIDYMRGEGLRNLNTVERRFICDTIENLQAQVKHLPRMVELLKRVSTMDYLARSQANIEAQAILRDINELPGEGAK